MRISITNFQLILTNHILYYKSNVWRVVLNGGEIVSFQVTEKQRMPNLLAVSCLARPYLVGTFQVKNDFECAHGFMFL